MKNQIALLTVFSTLLFSVTLSFAQPYGGAGFNPGRSYPSHRPVPGTILGRDGFAVSNHSLSAQILGLEYSFEGALTGNFTLVGRVGLVPTGLVLASSMSGTSSVHFDMAPGITLEPRIYTSFERRARMGRSTFMNSSDFVSAPVQFLFAGNGCVFTFTPQYGIRRTSGDHFAHEFTFGPRLAFYDDIVLSPHIQYRLVFMF
ncbi:MAG: hypothetical protein IJ654_07515 [Bacteroidales bacterium]|nr:hypothetical protein [Bacteroidales bacterium]